MRFECVFSPGLRRLNGETAHVYTDTRCYRAGTWDRERRVVIKAEVVRLAGREPRDNPRFVVTNLRQTPRFIYEKIYCARGDIENRSRAPPNSWLAQDAASSPSPTASGNTPGTGPEYAGETAGRRVESPDRVGVCVARFRTTVSRRSACAAGRFTGRPPAVRQLRRRSGDGCPRHPNAWRRIAGSMCCVSSARMIAAAVGVGACVTNADMRDLLGGAEAAGGRG